MEKNENDKLELFHQYLTERFTPPTEVKVQQWIIEEENTTELEEASLDYFNSLEAGSDPSAYYNLERVNRSIGYESIPLQKPKHICLYRIAAFILVLLIIGGGYVYYYQSYKTIEVVVPNSEEKHLVLPDNSEVWINSGSKLSYPAQFRENERNVYLEGEAYFSVKENSRMPFIVQTEKLSVTLLHTKLNIKAYTSEERTIVTLNSGKIEIKTMNDERFVLSPNQQLSYSHLTQNVQITEVKTTETDGWMKGQLIFSDASLEEIIKTLERRFDISIYADNDLLLTDETYTTKFMKNDSLEKVLNVLSDMVGFAYTKQGYGITLNIKE